MAEAVTSAYPPIPHRDIESLSSCLGPAPHSPIRASSITPDIARLRSMASGYLYAIGPCGNGAIVLWLAPGAEPIAREIRDTFGSAVKIGIGLTAWNGRPGRSPRCGDLSAPAAAPPPYSSSLVLRSRKIKIGGDLRGKVVLRATRTRGVEVATASPIEVVITKVRSRRVVGVFAGAIGGVARALAVSPGQDKAVSIAGGTARCDGGLGSALPPGNYNAVAEVSGIGVNGTAGGPGGSPPPTYFTQFVPIQIVR